MGDATTAPTQLLTKKEVDYFVNRLAFAFGIRSNASIDKFK